MRMINWLLAGLLFAGPAVAQQAADAVAPEAATELGAEALSEAVALSQDAKAQGKPVEAQSWMLSVANPHAAEAGAQVLASGGTAADAMVAVQAVLGLVEPQSSGLGGGAFLLWYDAKTGKQVSDETVRSRCQPRWPRDRPACRASDVVSKRAGCTAEVF